MAFEGKKIMYVHGFASSGQSGTVRHLREVLPQTTIIAPDVPVEPLEMLPLLQDICQKEQPNLIIGTSMGGMLTEMLYGFDRILVNPAFEIAETIRTNPDMGLGRHSFFNKRQDGATDFLVTKKTIQDFRTLTSQNFAHADEDRERVVGLFGRNDPLVHTFDIFRQHYRHAIRFNGEHRITDSVLLHTLLPAIQRIDNKQEHRQRPIVYIDIDCLRRDEKSEISEASFAFEKLFDRYQLYVLAPAEWNDAEKWNSVQHWADSFLGILAYNRVVLCQEPALIYGDYLISRNPCPDFMGTVLRFGEDPFRTWEDVLDFFSHLGGQ